MKTKLMMIFCVAMITMSGVCLASVRDDQIALGGIPLLCTTKDLHRIYGEPTEFDRQNREKETWSYGDSFSVRFTLGKYIYGRNNSLSQALVSVSILSEDANGIATPDGVTVGDSVEKMEAIYGEADKEFMTRNGDAYVYEYHSETSMRRLYFITNGGVIEKINCYYYI